MSAHYELVSCVLREGAQSVLKATPGAAVKAISGRSPHCDL